MDPNMATAEQVKQCKRLFRKVKLYYNTLDDDRLVAEVKKRTGFDLDNLTDDQAKAIVDKLGKRLKGRWRFIVKPSPPSSEREVDPRDTAKLAEINKMLEAAKQKP